MQANVSCFCNSPSCPQALCQSSQQCFSGLLRRVKADGNVSTSVSYGCIETLSPSLSCLNSSLLICCDKDLCNMPNMLRKITKTLQNRAQVDTKEHAFNDDQEDVEPVSNKCTESTPAMQVASVVAPSVLILTVILLSLGIFYKIARYQKIRISQLKRGFKHKASREGLIKKVQELKGCGLLVRQNVPEVFQTTAVISRSCSESDYRVLLSSPHNV
ncbi:uncharacterized protein LOC111338300 isoform X2 [Stylophora pistillata]|uniref:uncharacterized protein LOC111338300 isoform X2 n=1 Tax=Stylophora pistillata TaxID=50429 RepID=UPI000C050BDB|nr:uncharacterized protein LOC111338300 isoform X2 [Stylophora pistillata]